MSFVVIALIVVALVIVGLLFFKRFEQKEEYNAEKYEGKDTKKFPTTSKDLRELVSNREYKDLPNAEEFAKLLKSSLKTGLSGDDVELRKTHFGTNEFASPPMPTFISLFLDSFEDRTLQILLGSAILSMVLGITVAHEEGGWIEGVAILAAVLLVSSITALNDYNKEKQFRALSDVDADKQIKVLRGGNVRVISTYDIVCGDVLLLEAGDLIPADSVYITGDGIKVDESSLTGEPEPREITLDKNVLLSGCTVKEGVLRAIVVATGMNSVYGQVKALVEKERNNTPLQDKLEELADFIGWLGVGAATLTFIALVAKWVIYRFVTTDLGWEWSEAKHLVDMVITAITIVAMAVPEGLPLAVTISLAYSMIKMTKDQNLVRHLVACETMGGATQICSDKTGTLTQNKMTVTNVHINHLAYDSEKGHKIDGFVSSLHKSKAAMLVANIVINSSANVLMQDGKRVVSGSASEIALLEFVQKFDVDIPKLRREEEERVLRSFAFSSTKKRMSTLVRANNSRDRGSAVLYVKGASEVLLEECESEFDANGEVVPLTADRKEDILRQIEQWAKNGLRTLSLAQRELSLDGINYETVEDGDLDKRLTLFAIVGIKDPVREEVPSAVLDCQSAGIVVRMLTGDNILTAQDIARQCNIMKENDVALEGPAFRQMSDAQIIKILPRLTVIARCSPEDKLKMVKLLRAQGEVVAVTGDGTNDAPQLNEADVGFAMGIAGTEVAKQASDIILLDDNFNSIKKAVMWGRNVFLSIKKFIQFQLTVNICAVFMGLLGAIVTGETPLSAVQLLWVNLIMDTFAALALATDPPTPRLLKSPPYGRTASLITRKMWISIIGQVIFQLSVLIFVLFSDLEAVFHIEKANVEVVRGSLIFNLFVFCQIFNELNCRKVESDESVFSGFFSNKIFVTIMTFTVLMQYLLIEYGGAFVNTCPLTADLWAFTIGVSSLSLPIGALLRSLALQEFGQTNLERTRSGLHRDHQLAAHKVLTHETHEEAKVETINEALHGSKKKLTKRADQ